MEGFLELQIKERVTPLKSVRLLHKYLGRYYNFGRNCCRVKPRSNYIVVVDEERELLAIKVCPKQFENVTVLNKLRFSNVFKQGDESSVRLEKVEGCRFSTDVIVADHNSLWCLSADGRFVCADLTQTFEVLEGRVRLSKQLHLPGFTFTSICVYLNMVVAAAFSPAKKKVFLALMSKRLDDRDTLEFDCEQPVHVMHISMRDYIPILSVLTAKMKLHVFAVVGGKFKPVACKFSDLAGLNYFYQERSPLSFSSPFLRAQRLPFNEFSPR